MVRDSKVTAKYDYLYVPASDPVAVKYFQDIEKADVGGHRSPPLKVVVLPAPDKFTGDYVRNLDGEHGLLSLKLELDAQGKPTGGVPYVVPGGRFNELYCWDSYFIVLGFVARQARGSGAGHGRTICFMRCNIMWGRCPTPTALYYLIAFAAAPFLTSIIRTLYDAGAVDKTWLAAALKNCSRREYRNVWLGSDRLVKIGPYQLRPVLRQWRRAVSGS